MNTPRRLLASLTLAVIAGCSNVPGANGPPAELAISQSWSGDYPVAELGRMPAGQRSSRTGYLGSAATFAPVWAAFQPGEALPAVDFRTHLVVFHRNLDFYNRTGIFKVTLRDGVADVLATETMSAIPIGDEVAMAMAVIPRAEVKFIRAWPAGIPVREE